MNSEISDKVKIILDNFKADNLKNYDGHLIVDDDSDNRLVLKKMLKRMGFESEQAKNGLEALDMVSHKLYKIIWIDIGMPLLSGIDTIIYIRDNLKFKGPIYVTTGHTDSIIVYKCLEIGVTKIITKPFNINLIKNIVSEMTY